MLQEQQINYKWTNMVGRQVAQSAKILAEKKLTIGDKVMKFDYFCHGEKPKDGYTLIIGLHGGGGCPASVNDSQYSNHLHLYDTKLPKQCIWFVPRSCQDAWDMWWHSYLIEFFTTIIQTFTFTGQINPNKVFITGYSAGGDGIYHLGSMMADYLSGAAMMAGHPNNAQLYNMRNISFSIQVGGKDSAYERNDWAKKYIEKMEKLRQQFGGFKPNYNKIHQQKQHWMNKEDTHIFQMFFREIRNPYPDLILFKQHQRTRKRYMYYIEVNPEQHKQLIIIRKNNNLFEIQSAPINLTIYFNRYMVSLRQDIVIKYNGEVIKNFRLVANQDVINETIQQRKDPCYIFQNKVVLCLNQFPKKQAQILQKEKERQKTNITKEDSQIQRGCGCQLI